MASTPETRYALSGGNHIAYQVADGAGRDILYLPRTSTPIDLLWDDPIAARRLRRLTAFGRLIMCDLRGVGASDSIDTTRLPAMRKRAPIPGRGVLPIRRVRAFQRFARESATAS